MMVVRLFAITRSRIRRATILRSPLGFAGEHSPVLLVLVRAAAAVGNVNNDDPTSIDPIAAASSQKSWNAEIGIRTVAVVLFAIRGDHIPPCRLSSREKPRPLNAASLGADFLP